VDKERIRQLEELEKRVLEDKERRRSLRDSDVKVASVEIKIPFAAIEGILGGALHGVGEKSDVPHKDEMVDVPHHN